MPANPEFEATFAACREILRELEPKLILNADEPGNYWLDAGYSERHKKMICFGGVRIGKGYVSYHLMPVYGCPDLVRDMPSELRRRMQEYIEARDREIGDMTVERGKCEDELVVAADTVVAAMQECSKIGLINHRSSKFIGRKIYNRKRQEIE